jgi:hypothetical protein
LALNLTHGGWRDDDAWCCGAAATFFLKSVHLDGME